MMHFAVKKKRSFRELVLVIVPKFTNTTINKVQMSAIICKGIQCYTDFILSVSIYL